MAPVRVLVVEDEPDLCDLIQRHLRRLGYDTAGAKSAGEALEIIQNDPRGFSRFLVDLSLPDMPGDELAERILRAQPSAKILLTSGYALPAAIRVKSKRVWFLQKPFPPKRLEEALKVLSED
jgi:two-component system, cell cycle response regulator CpdR